MCWWVKQWECCTRTLGGVVMRACCVVINLWECDFHVHKIIHCIFWVILGHSPSLFLTHTHTHTHTSYPSLSILSDVNECTTGLHNCLPTSRCYNKFGTFVCLCGREICTGQCSRNGRRWDNGVSKLFGCENCTCNVSLSVTTSLVTISWQNTS